MSSYRVLGPEAWRAEIAACEIRQTQPGHEVAEDAYLVPSWPVKGSFVMKPNGEVVAGSVTARFVDPPSRVVAQPEIKDIARNAIIRDDHTYVFLGPLVYHFGHFLLESLSRLWYAADKNAMYVMVATPNVKVRSYVRSLWKNAGLDVSRLHFVTAPTRFKRLIVPEPGLRIGRYTYTVMRDVYRRIAQSTNLPPIEPQRRIYLSRSKWHESRSKWDSAQNEAELETALAARGFDIVHPQDLSIDEQIAAVRSAKHIVGLWGSAMHSVLFGHPQTRITHVFADEFDTSYYLTDQLAEADATYLLAAAGALGRRTKERERREPQVSVNVDEVLRAVE